MAFSASTPFPYQITPLTNIVPFTYRDGTTYLETLEKLRVWLNNSLVPEFNAGIDNAIKEFMRGIENAEKRVVETEELHKRLIAEAMDYVNKSVKDARDYVDRMTEFINNKTGVIDIQRAALGATPFTVKVGELWPTNHPVQYIVQQDSVGGRSVVLSPEVSGKLELDTTPNSVTEFSIIPVGNKKWRISQPVEDRTFIEVERTRRPGDISDSERFNRAIRKALTLGIPEVQAVGPRYELHARVDVGSLRNMTIRGMGANKVEIVSVAEEQINVFSISGDFKNLTIDGFNIVGSAIEIPKTPTRGRTYGPGSIKSAVYIFGDKALSQPISTVCENFTFSNNEVYGTQGLPLWLSGIRGIVKIVDNIFNNCLDVGVMYCDNAIFSRNRVYNGVDNGVSISRGCRNVTVTENYFENCCYWGVFSGGYLSDDDRTKVAHLGPHNVVIANNIGKGLGNGGVYMGVAPKNITVHDNHFSNIQRGPTDAPASSYGMGIYIGGLSDGKGGFTDVASDINIHDNTITDAPAGGVWINPGSHRIKIHHNTFLNVGSRFKFDGLTEIVPEDVNFNYGVINNDPNNTDIVVTDNEFLDLRATPYMNNPVNLKGAKDSVIRGNRARGNRVPLFEGYYPTVSGERLNLQRQDGIRRAAWEIDGANISFKVFTATGELVAEPMRSRVIDGAVTFNVPVLHSVPNRVTAYTSKNRPYSNLANGAMVFDETLGKPIWWNGDRWHDAMGTDVPAVTA